MKCKSCQYVWLERTKNPKKCPRCQKWIKYGKDGKKHEGKV